MTDTDRIEAASPVESVSREPSALSVGVAGVLCGVFALVLAAVVGGPVAVAIVFVALAGGGTFVWGAAVVATEGVSNRTVAVASVAAALGSLGLLVPLIWLPPGAALLLVPFVAAPVYVGLRGYREREVDAIGRLSRLCWRSRDAALLFTLPILAIASGAATAGFRGGLRVGRSILGSSLLGSLLVLLALGYLLTYFLPRAQAVLQSRAGLSADRGLQGVVVGDRPLDELLTVIRVRSHEFWWVAGVPAFLLVVGVGPALDAALASLPVVGPAALFVTTSGLVHVPVAAVLLIAVATVAGGYVHAFVVEWASLDPPRTFASATGGVVLGLVALPTLLVPGWSQSLLPPNLAPIGTTVGAGTVLLGGVTLLLLVVPIALYFPPAVASGLSLASDRTAEFVTASALLLVGSVIGALQDVPAVLVFTGVALSVLIWDLGEQAGYLGATIGDVDTRGPELVHALASIAVGVVGVVLAAVVGYVVGPITLPTGSSRAFLAIALALVAALAFSLSLSRTRDT